MVTKMITATFENGVLKPTEPLSLPEHSEVRLLLELPKSELQKEWEATKEQRLAALEELFKLAKPHPGPHMTRDELNERR